MKNLKPITRQETLLAKVAGQDVPDLVPITREEFFLAKAGGQDVPELEPITREEYFLADVIEAIESGGGGGSDLGTKTVIENGVYKASDDSLDGYSKVTVNVPASAVDSGTKSISSNGTHDVTGYASASVSVPNTYSAGDEGKVVSNGALVSQTSDTVTENDTYDTTLINSLTVNVSGGFDLPLTYHSSSVVVRNGYNIQPTFPIVNGKQIMGVVHDSGHPTWCELVFARFSGDGSKVWYGKWVNQGASYNNYSTVEGETTYTPAAFSFFPAWNDATTETVDYYLMEESA